MDSPRASWHPALMPNSNPQTHPSPASTKPRPDQPADPADNFTPPPSSPSSDDGPERASLDSQQVDEKESTQPAPAPAPEPRAADTPEWPPDDRNVAPSEFPAPTEDGDEAGLPEFAPAADDADDAGVVQQPHPTELPELPEQLAVSPPTGPVPDSVKTHSRPDSFARTVSGGINWNDDDDTSDFTLSRSTTDDPFNFLSPSDRSSSFPDVSPVSRPAEQPQAHPLRQTINDGADFFGDAGDLGEPADDSGDFFNSGGSALLAEEDDGPEPDAHGRPHVSFGGEVLADEVVDEEARFEEGIPLMQHDSEEPSPDFSSSMDAHDPFASSSSPVDDFFSSRNIPDASHPDDHAFPPSLTRKTTTQVTGLASSDNSPAIDDELSSQGEEDVERSDELDEDAHGNALDDDHDQHDDGDWMTETSSAVPGATPDLSKPSSAADQGAASKWDAVFADDDDDGFLESSPSPVAPDTAQEGRASTPKKELDPADLFGSDDEGFLDLDDDFLPDDEPAPSAPVNGTAPTQPPQVAAPPAAPSRSSSRYVPQTAAPSSQPAQSTYNWVGMSAAPSPFVGIPMGEPAPGQVGFASPVSPLGTQNAPLQQQAPSQQQQQQQQQQPPPEPPRAESFADKSRGGYSSPYDLPSDLVSSRKPQKAQRTAPMAAPPSRTVSSTQAHPAPPTAPPPLAGPGLSQKASAPPLPAHPPGFFEELPMAPPPKSRPVSRGRTSSPKQHRMPFEQPPMPTPPMTSPPGVASMGPAPGYAPALPPGAPPMTPQAQVSRYAPSPVPSLVAPKKVNPYAPVPQPHQPEHVPPPNMSNNASRYSPAQQRVPPNHVPPPPSNRYSPASTRAASHSHVPRTSSPLAHFEVTHERQPGLLPSSLEHPDRQRSVSAYEARGGRMSSLPPMREEDENEGRPMQTLSPEQSSFEVPARHTPPSMAGHPEAMLSPPKRHHKNYAPLPPSSQQRESGLIPPVRSQTMSPGGRSTSREPPPRPASVQSAQVGGPTYGGPAYAGFTYASSVSAGPAHAGPAKPSNVSFAPASRPRGLSATFDLLPPNDARQQDPLQRWRGAPLLTWGVGGSVITTFPKDVPRYLPGQSTPLVVRTPGEVVVRSIKEVSPLDDVLAKFPGPLRGKSQKKEAIAWLASGIDKLERALPDYNVDANLSHLNKRDREKILLWKVLKVLVEFDGVLEGAPAVEAAVRDVLAPELKSADASSPLYPQADPGLGIIASQAQADAVDPAALDSIRRSLMVGDREAAVWVAVDKRLWGHAMLIANTVSPELYGKVTHEFVRKEVNHPGHNNEPMAALYNVLSGNFEECVDELVPAHARAGFQMMRATGPSGPARDAVDGLDKWQETLCLILGNRRPDDAQAIAALGRLLGGYGRAEAAHVCFIFARAVSVFHGLDDPNADFVLVGADHVNHPDPIAKDTSALLLSEVYEFALSLTGSAATAAGCPHLTAYKLQHAMTLAEYGHSDRALAYCDAIARAMTAQTRRSLYHNAVLEAAVADLTGRLRHAHKEDSGGWISKPSMNKVSDTVWNKFTKFVAGDDDGADGPGEGGRQGPFAHVSNTPTISRSPSTDNLGGMYGPVAGAGYPMGGGAAPTAGAPMGASVPASAPAPAPTRAGSRYAPGHQAHGGGNPYSPSTRPSTGRSSGEYMRPNPYEPSSRHVESRPTSSYAPQPSASHANNNHANNYTNNFTNNHTPSVPSSLTQSPYMAQGSAASSAPYGSPLGQSQSSLMPMASPYTPFGVQAPSQMYGGVGSSGNSPEIASGAAGHGVPHNAVDGLAQGVSSMSLGYEPPSMATQVTSIEDAGETGGYEPPSYQPYTYEPPSYQPPEPDAADDDERPRPKKSFMDDDGDDIPALKPQGNSREDKEREAQEAFRKAAEEDAKRHAEQEKAKQPTKRGWGFGSWFGGKGEKPASPGSEPNKPIKAKLGEQNSFVYDTTLKRWVNKAPGSQSAEAPKATPPPSKTIIPRSVSGPLASTTTTPPPPSASAPPMPPMPTAGTPHDSGGLLAPPPLMPPPLSRSASSASLAASRPGTSMSNASSIDDLLGPPTGRRAGGKKKKVASRYVDVMTKEG